MKLMISVILITSAKKLYNYIYLSYTKRKGIFMLSIITLVASGVLCYGIADIYKTKTNPEEKKSIAKGVSSTILGLAGIAFANPVFDSFLLSAIVDIAYVGFLTGFISHTFLKTKPEEIVYNAELLTGEDDKQEGQQEQVKSIEGRKKDVTPMVVNHFAEEQEKYPVRYR